MTQFGMVPAGQHKLPPLPYPYNALEPVIGEETMHIHHDIHHKAYVDGLNAAEMNLAEARKTNSFEYIQYWENQLAFNGSGDILHSIFWTVMAPPGTGGKPYPLTLNHINSYFGNFENFKGQFINAALKVEGSGWGILIWQPAWERMEILQAGIHQNLTQWGGIPILVCDIWEHAYYLDYQNRRKDYILAWWNLINWHEVEQRLSIAMNCRMPIEKI